MARATTQQLKTALRLLLETGPKEYAGPRLEGIPQCDCDLCVHYRRAREGAERLLNAKA
jgi:hypothetical protein